MQRLGLERSLVDRGVYDRTVDRFREAGIVLPTFAQLADPTLIPAQITERLGRVGPDDQHPLNLFRVHWFNSLDRKSRVKVPEHLVLPKELTGVDAPIVVMLGDRFPMIAAHKVLAAYGCLVPRVVTGQFDPTRQRAVWPSTGNYCRGGVAISRLMRTRGVAVLPEGMSEERFRWLDEWVVSPDDVIKTPGTESNVKEIYDRCAELSRDPDNVIFNQFSEFGNHLVHYLCTGRAAEVVMESMAQGRPGLKARAFVSATGSAGTIAAGDYLKNVYGSLTVAVEAAECPTMLANGFGEHNIQGIGDKHIPLIHNVMNTDLAVAVSDRATDRLNVLFQSPAGRRYLGERRGVAGAALEGLASLGLSSICNILAAIKTVKYFGWGPDDVVLTVATDGAAMYRTEAEKYLARHHPDGIDDAGLAEMFGEHVLGAATDNLLELSHRDRERIFNLGYFTWVEQQGVSFEEFTARKSQSFWRDMRSILPEWDHMIEEFNAKTAATKAR
ncbi:MAG: pyridoxal-5'-phosphate-dependent protein subunit beta [Candidatus Dormibacterales bacterium]